MDQPIPTTPPDFDTTRVIERPDGYYWQSLADGREYGPFATLLDVTSDMQAFDEENEGEQFEALREAEDVLGVPDWVDPETGELADDEWTRTEEH